MSLTSAGFSPITCGHSRTRDIVLVVEYFPEVPKFNPQYSQKKPQPTNQSSMGVSPMPGFERLQAEPAMGVLRLFFQL
jgi:hypothetical protein